ncbi:hypothetical protein OAC75_05205 [Pseudomonadales bacterium]|nr:hypothetical protein [Pseudomonadales bacterium]
MNYHAGINRMDRFMKRALLIISTTLSCLGLTGCSWMSQDPCSGKDADLSNPACVVQSKQIYRDNDARWYCIGHLEAKDWSCASSLKEAQTKHDAISKVIAQVGGVPTEVDALERFLDLDPASAPRMNAANTRPQQGAQQANAKDNETRLAAIVSNLSGPESPVLGEILSRVADEKSVGDDFETIPTAAKKFDNTNIKQSLNSEIANSALELSGNMAMVNAEPSTPSAAVLEIQTSVADDDVMAKVAIEESIGATTTIPKSMTSPESVALRDAALPESTDLTLNAAPLAALTLEAVTIDPASLEIEQPKAELSQAVTLAPEQTDRVEDLDLQIEVADPGFQPVAENAAAQRMPEEDQRVSTLIATNQTVSPAESIQSALEDLPVVTQTDPIMAVADVAQVAASERASFTGDETAATPNLTLNQNTEQTPSASAIEIQAEATALPAAMVATSDKSAVIEAPSVVVTLPEPVIVAGDETPSIEIPTAAPEIASAETAADAVVIPGRDANGIEPPSDIKVMQVGLSEYQNANTLPEVPEETSELASAMVALPSKHATSVGIEEPVAVVEARELLVIAEIEAPVTEALAETRELTAFLVEVVTEPALIDETESTLAKLPKPLRAAAVEAPTVDIGLEVPDQAIAFVETESAPILGDETAAPVFIEQAQVVLADDQIPSPLAEVPEATSALASAIVAVAANRAVATVIDAPIVLVELPKAAVVAAVEMPITESIADAPTLATAMAYTTPETRALAMSETPTSIESEQPSLADSQIAGTLAGDPFETPEPTSAQIAPAGNRGMPSVIEAPVAVDEILVAVDAVSPAFEVSTTKTPAIENEDEALEFAVTIVDSAVESALLDVIAVPATVENVRPILTDTQNDAPRIAVEGLAAQVVTTNARPDVATIASEIVIPATEPFPAGTTLAEVYTDHVQRSEQLPAGLQTLGPKGALPSPAVASTSSVRPSDLQVQRNRTPNRANGQIERYTQAEPFVTAVASAAKLNSIPMDRPELDYDSMARPATSGDGTYDYFMDLPSDDFAIQLIAQKSLSSIRTFASTVNLEDPLVLKTQLMERPLYVLVLDTFNDIQLASDAKRAWMVQYDNGIEPWIRTVGSLQKTMQPIGPMD